RPPSFPYPTLFRSGTARIVRTLDQLGQGQRIAQAEIEALGPDRVQALRRIADQYRTRRRCRVRAGTHRRISAARPGFEESPGAPAERILQPRQPTGVVQGSDSIGLFARHAMDHAVMAIATRQQRRRTVVTETLPC